jgi:hypothetical protein
MSFEDAQRAYDNMSPSEYDEADCNEADFCEDDDEDLNAECAWEVRNV